jgi:hypothetical protein
MIVGFTTGKKSNETEILPVDENAVIFDWKAAYCNL